MEPKSVHSIYNRSQARSSRIVLVCYDPRVMGIGIFTLLVLAFPGRVELPASGLLARGRTCRHGDQAGIAR
jgi:hypothetical protein